jgi:hypothetical protein
MVGEPSAPVVAYRAFASDGAVTTIATNVGLLWLVEDALAALASAMGPRRGCQRTPCRSLARLSADVRAGVHHVGVQLLAECWLQVSPDPAGFGERHWADDQEGLCYLGQVTWRGCLSQPRS